MNVIEKWLTHSWIYITFIERMPFWALTTITESRKPRFRWQLNITIWAVRTWRNDPFFNGNTSLKTLTRAHKSINLAVTADKECQWKLGPQKWRKKAKYSNTRHISLYEAVQISFYHEDSISSLPCIQAGLLSWLHECSPLASIQR